MSRKTQLCVEGWKWKCLRKRRYWTEEEAWGTREELRRVKGEEEGTRLAVYECRECGAWHVGNMRGAEVGGLGV